MQDDDTRKATLLRPSLELTTDQAGLRVLRRPGLPRWSSFRRVGLALALLGVGVGFVSAPPGWCIIGLGGFIYVLGILAEAETGGSFPGRIQVRGSFSLLRTAGDYRDQGGLELEVDGKRCGPVVPVAVATLREAVGSTDQLHVYLVFERGALMLLNTQFGDESAFLAGERVARALDLSFYSEPFRHSPPGAEIFAAAVSLIAAVVGIVGLSVCVGSLAPSLQHTAAALLLIPTGMILARVLPRFFDRTAIVDRLKERVGAEYLR